MAKMPPIVSVVPLNNPIIQKIILIIKDANIINAIIADKTAPKIDKISPATDKPFTVFDLIRSKMNRPMPRIEKNAERISQREGKYFKNGAGDAQTQNREDKRPHISEIMFIKGCLNVICDG